MKHFHGVLADSASMQSQCTLSSDLVTFILTVARMAGFLHRPKNLLLRQAQTKLKELIQVRICFFWLRFNSYLIRNKHVLVNSK